MVYIDNRYRRAETTKNMSICQIGKHKGELNNFCSISEKCAKQIIVLLKLKHKIKDISKMLNISYKTIYHIRNKETWTHLTNNIDFDKSESSIYIGVSWDKSCKKWKAKLNYKKKLVYLKYFNSEKEAAISRDKEAIKYMGDKARLNFNNNIKRTSRD